MHMKELPMFTYNLWMGTLPGACTQIHHVNYCVHAVINIAMSNNFKYSHVQFTQFVFSNKARFSHTSNVTRLHYCSGKKLMRTPCVHLVVIKKSIFLNIFRIKYKIQKVLVFHSVLLGCPQSCSKRADTMLYYYFHIKEEHFKMF